MKKYIKCSIVLCVLLVPGMAMAVNQTWVNWSGNQDWSQTNNWNGLAVPGAADEAYFNVTGIDGAIVNSNNLFVSRVVLDNGSSLAFAVGSGLENTGQHLSGFGASVDQTTVSGTYSVATEFSIGQTGSASLTVNSGGTVTSTGPWLISGWQVGSTGEILVDGGTLTAGNLHIGWAGDGVLRLTNGASVTSSGPMNVAVDPTATGLIEINGGVLAIGGLNAGATTGSATITLNGGQLINSGGFIQNSNAVFNINGGEFIFMDSTLAGINWAIDNGGGTWNFAAFRSVVDNGDGSVTVSSTSALPAPTIVNSSVSNSVMAIVVNTPVGVENYYYPLACDDLIITNWVAIAHSDDGVNPFVVSNLSYSATDASGTNNVIYVQTTDAQKFFKIEGGQP